MQSFRIDIISSFPLRFQYLQVSNQNKSPSALCGIAPIAVNPTLTHTSQRADNFASWARSKSHAPRQSIVMKSQIQQSSPSASGMSRHPSYQASKVAEACDSGLPDIETCTLDFSSESFDEGDTTRETTTKVLDGHSGDRQDHVFGEAWSRGRWLLGLLVLQSASSIVLDRYSDLIREHLVVTLFLTMLVGAGGNAGNQSAIKIIRGLATGKIDCTTSSLQSSVLQQARVGVVLGTALSIGGFARVYISDGGIVNALAIASSLMAIVMTSVVLGSALPFLLSRVGVDPANAGTSIQVIMDIFGVALTCGTCDFVFTQFAASL